MLSRIELEKRIRKEFPESSDGWKTDQTLEGVKLGNFVWKRQRNFFKRMFFLYEKYHYEATPEALEEYLQRRNDDVQFTLKKYCFVKLSPAISIEKNQTYDAGVLKFVEGKVQNSYKAKIPALQLTKTIIKKRDLELNLQKWKLDMTSSYIKEKERNMDIPCIINEIVEAAIPENQADTMASVEKKRRIEGKANFDQLLGTGVDVLDCVIPKVNIAEDTSEKTEGYIQGPVLYKVVPLEVDPTGNIEAKEDSIGFLKDKVVSDSACGNFSATNPAPTLVSSFNDIEQLLQPVIEDRSVANAFGSISMEDIHYLCRLFERVQDSPEDVEVLDEMSQECRTILLFAKFRSQGPDKLILKEKFQCDPSFISCYYLAAVLAEVQTSIREFFAQTTVNLFPLLKSIVLERPREEIVIDDDILKCNEAQALLEKLDISTKESTVVGIPTSPNLLVNVVWIAMLYGWQSREEQL